MTASDPDWVAEVFIAELTDGETPKYGLHLRGFRLKSKELDQYNPNPSRQKPLQEKTTHKIDKGRLLAWKTVTRQSAATSRLRCSAIRPPKGSCDRLEALDAPARRRTITRPTITMARFQQDLTQI